MVPSQIDKDQPRETKHLSGNNFKKSQGSKLTRYINDIPVTDYIRGKKGLG